MKRATLGTALAAALAAGLAAAAPAPGARPSRPARSRPTNDVTLSVGTGRLVRLDGAMTDLFVANDDDRRRPGPLAQPDLHLRQGRRRDHRLCDRPRRPGRLFGQRPRRPESRLGRRDARTSRCPRPTSRRDADERHGAADRHRRRSPPTRGGRAPRPGLRRRRHAGGQPPAHRDAAAGDAAGQDRRGQPLAGPRDRRQPAQPRQYAAASCSASAGAIPARSPTGSRSARSTRPPGIRQYSAPTSRSTTPRAPRRSAPPAACSASTCSARSTSPRTTAWSPRSPSRP